MAAFLNKPSDFTAKSEDRESQSPLQLLPPSEFEKPKTKGTEPWQQELGKLTEEIMALKLENRQLRDRCDRHNASSSSLQQYSPMTHRSMPAEERRYADELISRQAEEISKLKSKTQRLECEQRSMREQYEQKLAELEEEKEDRVASLSNRLLHQEQEYEQQVIRLSLAHEGEVSDLQSRVEHLSADLEQTKVRLTSQIAELTQELQSTQDKSRDVEERLKQDIREKECALQSATQQVQQLRTYMTESEQKHRPQQVWQQACEKLNNKLKIAESEKETLQSSIQLMEVRLSSIKEILATQEAELSKAKEETIDKNKQKELLLTKWRQKVYDLLVQQKSSDLIGAKDLQNWQAKTSLLQDQLYAAHCTVNILQSKVADKDAEIQLGANTIKKLQDEVKQAQQVALSLDDRLAESGNVVQGLLDFAKSCEDRFAPQAHTLQQALSQLKSLGQRVSFASSRMELIKSQLARREALKELEKGQTEKEKANSDTEDSWRAERDQLVQELERVSKERDLVASQLKRDSEAWSEKITSMRSQYDSEVRSLKRTAEDLETANQEKSQTIEQLLETQEACQSELLETTERVHELRTELARHEHTMHQALEDQKKELEGEWTEQLAEMERKLNDARREHTKAVVTWRQLERQMGRERERTQELQATTEAHFVAQLGHMQQQLQAMERERNIFMATLRQEGLLGKLRSERGEPIRLQLQEETEENKAATDSVTEVMETDTQEPQDSSEPMSAVLEDLKALAPAVLDDTLEESSDENQ